MEWAVYSGCRTKIWIDEESEISAENDIKEDLLAV